MRIHVSFIDRVGITQEVLALLGARNLQICTAIMEYGYRIIDDLAKSGVAILAISSELPELIGISDRILVMREGRVAGELLHGDADEVKALHLAMPAR